MDIDTTKDPVASAGLPHWHPAVLIATFLGIGRLPKAPGTWASLIALPLAWIIYYLGGPPVLLLVAFYFACIGWWAAQVYVKRTGLEDPGVVVIDEIAAQMLVFMAAPPTLLNLAVGFVLFRLFDILKPWPVSWADRHIKGGFGAMLDDLLAAGYAGLCLWLFDAIVADITIPINTTTAG